MSELCDYLFAGGRLVDGSGEGARYSDVAVEGDRIVAVGSNLKERFDPGKTLDITGKVISPGFIDLHTHSDVSILINPRMESSIHQGVTTEMFGNCGLSIGLMRFAPQFELERRWTDRGGLTVDWTEMGQFFERIESQGVAINVATLAGHGTIRKDILEFSERAPDVAELGRMKDRLTRAMEQGAFGLSSGLEYLPGGYADLDELCALAECIRPFGGFYASHIRDERDHLVTSVEEALAVGRRADVPVQLSHHKVERKRNWGTVKRTLGMMREARESGMDVSTDQYPYTAFMTGLAVILLPQWAQGGGSAAVTERLNDPATRAKIMEYIHSDQPDCDSIRIGVARKRRDVQGLSLTALGSLAQKPPIEAALNLLSEEEGMVSAAYFAMSEDDVEEIMRDPFTMIGSDGVASSPEGILGEDHTHPRTYGTFPRVLGEYVRQRNVISLEEAIRRMTSLPASRMKLRDRGVVEPGFFADLVVFDPENIVDVASFDRPHQFSNGIFHVVVNGRLAIEDGVQTDVLAGKVIRRPQAV